MREKTYHIDDLDGPVTLFKSTDEGTETIAVFDEEHREVIQELLAEILRLKIKRDGFKRINHEWQRQFAELNITFTESGSLTFVEESKEVDEYEQLRRWREMNNDYETEVIGVYHVEGVGYCTGLAWAKKQAGSFGAPSPVFDSWETTEGETEDDVDVLVMPTDEEYAKWLQEQEESE